MPSFDQRGKAGRLIHGEQMLILVKELQFNGHCLILPNSLFRGYNFGQFRDKGLSALIF